MTQDFEQFREWVGRKDRRTDTITAWPVTALAATLDDAKVSSEPGRPLPQGWHWMFFLEAKPQSELGPDGHPKRGGFLPPVPLPRRMWAGGRLQWLQPLHVSDALRRESRIVSVTHKSGRSGDLVFVLVRHEVHNAQGLALAEEHDIVYRPMAKASDPQPAPKRAEADAPWQREIVPDDVLLFRYSALTFNGHRIHYDRKYVTGVE